MKANAPEKIYVHEASAPELTDNLPYHIEYTRTDAFIDKAVLWMKQKSAIRYHLSEELIEDFKDYMKGE